MGAVFMLGSARLPAFSKGPGPPWPCLPGKGQLLHTPIEPT